MRQVTPMRLLALASLCVASVPSAAQNFTPGAVCAGVDMTSTMASEMLRGRHLVINELAWLPFAVQL